MGRSLSALVARQWEFAVSSVIEALVGQIDGRCVLRVLGRAPNVDLAGGRFLVLLGGDRWQAQDVRVDFVAERIGRTITNGTAALKAGQDLADVGPNASAWVASVTAECNAEFVSLGSELPRPGKSKGAVLAALSRVPGTVVGV
jgi:hypothetical protein